MVHSPNTQNGVQHWGKIKLLILITALFTFPKVFQLHYVMYKSTLD